MNKYEIRAIITIICFLCGSIIGTTIFEEIRISKRDHIIANQKLLLSVHPEDSIKFECTHCGWKHVLQVQQDSIR